jgi:ribonuclease D
MNQRRWQQSMRELSESVQRGLDNPEPEAPRRERVELPGQLNVLGQFLGSALTSICHRAQVAASLVGTASDVRELIGYHLGFRNANGELPTLAEGWRADVVGHLIEDLLKGKKSIRIADPMSDEPLVFTNV